jgi:acetoin utilization deacetylase AcuC-like enzyme
MTRDNVHTVYAFMEMFMYHDTSSQSVGYFASGITRDNESGKFVFLEPSQSFENSDTKKRLHNILEATNLILSHLYRIPSNLIQPAPLELLYKFHTKEYIDRIQKLSLIHGSHDAGESVPFGKGSFEIARHAVGACLSCVDSIMDPMNNIKNGYALVRPPGHHAERDKGRGYCMLANVALTAIHLQQQYNLKKIAIFDFDVHHGNGTQQAFYNDPSVLYISIHEEDHFPKNSGHLNETGEGDGVGYNLNIPLPPGSGIGAYQYAMDQAVVPALEKFKPDFILVSAGYDACILDPLGRMQLVSSSYRYMTEKLLQVASEVCQDRLCFFHEGGYSPILVPLCGYKVIETLCGISESESQVEDPFDKEEVPKTTQRLKPHEKVVVDQAVELINKYHN